jgi:hypothetical protein
MLLRRAFVAHQDVLRACACVTGNRDPVDLSSLIDYINDLRVNELKGSES